MDEPSNYPTDHPSCESDVSIVIPLNNEAEHLPFLVRDIRAVMSSQPLPWEMILVDDGSTDDTLNRLLSAREEFSNLTVLSLKRCCGQSAATWLGLLQAKGSIVVTLDGDGQFEPGDILTLISEVTAGMDFAIGHRQFRADRWHKRLFSKVSNGLRRVLTNSSLPETGIIIQKAMCSLWHQRRNFHDPSATPRGSLLARSTSVSMNMHALDRRAAITGLKSSENIHLLVRSFFIASSQKKDKSVMI